MEIPPAVNLEGRQSWTDLSHKFSTQEVSSKSSANGSPDHRGNNSLSESCSLLESDHNVVKLKKSFVHVGHNYNEFVEAACLQEPERVSVIPGDAPLDLSPLASTQLHKAGFVSTSPCSNEDCCDNFAFPPPGIKGQCDQVFYPGEKADLNCDYVKTDFKKTKTISNGYIILNPEDTCLTPNLNSSPALTVTETEPDSSRRVQDLPRIVKHKLSSITFSDYSDYHAFINESSDDGEHKRNGKDNPKKRGAVSARAEMDHIGSKSGEGETSIKEESPQVRSPWSESMNHLMRKLDQLNLDIEEALSASSSPCDTPRTTSKKQRGAVSKSTLNQTLSDQTFQRPDRATACPSQDRSSAPRGASMGTRARTKKTMTDAAGAGTRSVTSYAKFTSKSSFVDPAQTIKGAAGMTTA
ncbi:hypothetical protein PAMP_018344 [Pampus punctatissimus]